MLRKGVRRGIGLSSINARASLSPARGRGEASVPKVMLFPIDGVTRDDAAAFILSAYVHAPRFHRRRMLT